MERLASYQYHQAPWTPPNAAHPSGKRYTHERVKTTKFKDMRREQEQAQPPVGGVSMNRTRSDGMVADVSGGESHGDPVKEQDLLDQRHRAKSLVRIVVNGPDCAGSFTSVYPCAFMHV